jgi:hypothetical protein
MIYGGQSLSSFGSCPHIIRVLYLAAGGMKLQRVWAEARNNGTYCLLLHAGVVRCMCTHARMYVCMYLYVCMCGRFRGGGKRWKFVRLHMLINEHEGTPGLALALAVNLPRGLR